MTAIAALLERPWIARLGWCLVHSTWEIAIAALATAVILRLLRNSSANVRYLIACTSLAVMAALPVATFGWLDPRHGG